MLLFEWETVGTRRNLFHWILTIVAFVSTETERKGVWTSTFRMLLDRTKKIAPSRRWTAELNFNEHLRAISFPFFHLALLRRITRVYCFIAHDMRGHRAGGFSFQVHKHIPWALLNKYEHEIAFEISISERCLGKEFLRELWIDITSVILLYSTLLRIITAFKDFPNFKCTVNVISDPYCQLPRFESV